MNRALYIVCILIFTSLNSYGGAWNKDKGHGYTQFSFTYLSYDRLHQGSDGIIDLKRTIGDYTLQFYSEYGLSNNINLILNLPYKFVSSGSSLNEASNDPYINDTLDPGNLNGLSNLGIGLRFKLLEKSYVLSAQIDIYNRMHQYQPNSGMRIGYNAFLVYPSLLFGKGWSEYYLQLQAGLMINSSDYSQNAFGNLEIGKKFWEGKSYLVFRVDYKLPLNVGVFNEGNSVQTGLFRDNSSYISPGFKWIQSIGEHLYLNLAAYGGIVSNNEGAVASINFGLAYEW